MTNKKTFRAFSLIELSIVILVVGIIVAGVTQSSRLVSRMKIMTAKSLTKNSPIASIKDLTLWLDSTSDESFPSILGDDNGVSQWNDISPQSANKNNATQSNSALRPIYKDNAINGLPALLFDGVDDILINQEMFTDVNVSIFAVVVDQSSSTTYTRIISARNDVVFYFGVRRSATNNVLTALYGTRTGGWPSVNDFGTSILLYNNIPYVLANTLSGTANSGYINGSLVGTNTQTNGKIAGNDGYGVGSYPLDSLLQPWKGYIGEIIMFNRAVTSEERNEITKYLGKKWGIKT